MCMFGETKMVDLHNVSNGNSQEFQQSVGKIRIYSSPLQLNPVLAFTILPFKKSRSRSWNRQKQITCNFLLPVTGIQVYQIVVRESVGGLPPIDRSKLFEGSQPQRSHLPKQFFSLSTFWPSFSQITAGHLRGRRHFAQTFATHCQSIYLFFFCLIYQ